MRLDRTVVATRAIELAAGGALTAVLARGVPAVVAALVTTSATVIPTLVTTSPAVIPTIIPTLVTTSPAVIPTIIPTLVTTSPAVIPTIIPTLVTTSAAVIPTVIPTLVTTSAAVIPTIVPTLVTTSAAVIPTIIPTLVTTTAVVPALVTTTTVIATALIASAVAAVVTLAPLVGATLRAVLGPSRCAVALATVAVGPSGEFAAVLTGRAVAAAGLASLLADAGALDLELLGAGPAGLLTVHGFLRHLKFFPCRCASVLRNSRNQGTRTRPALSAGTAVSLWGTLGAGDLGAHHTGKFTNERKIA
ncbi:hypothetical protein [Flexivirga endophytica]|uniref:hypothetical protein n=1 Tax=Flexivirga endophytica TaxID=1849103 RepID=UPI0027E406ED|nr:hypothetical protein [Flexivirga endophytica]